MLFKILNRNSILGLAVLLLGLHSTPAIADPIEPATALNTLPIGGLAIKQETLVYLIKSFAVDSLKKTLKPISNDTDPTADADQFQISLPEVNDTIPLPVASNTAVGQIFDVLNIKGPVGIKLDPATIKLGLPDSAFSIQVTPPTQKNPNTFTVNAAWRITELSAHSNNFALNIPKGLFSESFSLIASPIDFSVKEGHSIDFSISFSATLSPDGAKIALDDFKSNIIESTDAAILDLKVGPISQVTAEKTVTGKDLILSIENKSDGFGIEANEKDIQNYFTSFEPQIFDQLRKTLVPLIHENLQRAAKEFQDQKPFHYPLNTNTLLSSLKLSDEDVKTLLSNIQFDISLSAVSSMGAGKEVFAAQVSTEICMDGQCAESAIKPSIPQDRDVLSVIQTENGIGVGIYQSLLKDILHAPAIQTRIENYFSSVVKKVLNGAGTVEKYFAQAGDGIHLGQKAIFIAFDPDTQEIALVVNFDIEPSKLGLADWVFNEGTHFYLPFQLKAKIGSIEKDQSGNLSVPLSFSPPIDSNGNISPITICNESDCPNSISDDKTNATIADISKYGKYIGFTQSGLKSVVQKFNLSLRSRMMAFLPEGKFNIPIPNNIAYQGTHFVPKSVEITPDRQLIFVGQIDHEEPKNVK